MVNTTENIKYIKDIDLPSGKVLNVVKKFKGKHLRQAQKLSGDDPSLIPYAVISLTCHLDTKPILMEDIDELDGADVITMLDVMNVPT